jgi:serine/threonine-protein kinase
VSDDRWRETDCPVRQGDLIAGKYRVERILGAGGMGVVVAAMQVDLERAVALKFLLPRVLERPDHVARFAREARAAARLESEHVTRVLDVGALESGAAYIVMEYLEGEDLGNVLARRGPLPCAEAVGYLLEASEGIAEAHSLGIVHRDLKPANLFLTHRTNGRPIIKVLDFGLSKISTGDEHVTSDSSILGSPLYMSPEQLLSARTADARSDIWSLGVTLYELLTARQAFPGDKMPKLVAAIMHGREEPLTSVRPDIPAGLRALVHQCLEKDPSKRFPDIAHFARALAPFGPPSRRASVDRISHLLGRAGSTPPGANDSPAPASLPDAKVGGESLPGASQSVTLPSYAPLYASRGAPLARTGARRGRMIGFAAVLAAAAAIVAIARTTAKSGDSPVASAVGLAPSRSAVEAFVDLSRPPEGPRVLPPSVAEFSPPPPAPAAVVSSTHPTIANAAPPRATSAPRVAATSPLPASPPSAASSVAPAPSAPVDPLAKLRRL